MTYVTEKDAKVLLATLRDCGPPLESGGRMSMTLHADVLRVVEQLASDYGITRQDVVRACVFGYLNASGLIP